MVTLVTGGASGLGKAVCEKLITDGSRVLICDLPSSNGLDLAKQLGDNTHFVPADVRMHICEISKEKNNINSF